MMTGRVLHEMLFKLEQELLDPEVRKNTTKLNTLLSPYFFEFGSSGTTWGRKEIFESLSREKSTKITASNFEAHDLAEGVVLVTYKSKRDDGGTISEALRSSIWKLYGDQWQMFFHQGTIIN
jgi:hypothetical protein